VLVIADLLAASVSLPLALLVLSPVSSSPGNSLRHFGLNITSDAFFPVAIVLAMAVAGFYRSNRRAPYESSFSELKEISITLCGGCVLAIGASLVLHIGFKTAESDSTQLLLAATLTIVVITCGRATIGAFRRGVHSKVLIVGSGSLVDRVVTYLSITKGVQYLGRVGDPLKAEKGLLGTVSDLPGLCAQLQANRIIIAYPTSVSHESIATLRSLPSSVHISVIPRYFELVSWRSRIADLRGLPLIDVAPTSLTRWDRFLKRGFDIVVSLLLILLFLPVLCLLAASVKLTSPGPVVFTQQRVVGQRRKLFTIYKFRTMVAAEPTPGDDREDDAQDALTPLRELRNKAEEALRITRVDGLLRRTGLDEIPQFVNVLLGQMSLVGPRPFKESESEIFTGWQARRFEFRPGITGLWQVSRRNDLSMADLRHLDYLYVSSWSLWWDIKIVWDTPRAMVRGFGAY
jgi:exopolysaccharide biosynthesis polyprenyl glycosylphosphotransferase